MVRKCPDLKWLVQNGRSIIFRNVYSDKMTSSCTTTTEMEIIVKIGDVEHVILKSDIICGSCNPSWSFSSLETSDTLWECLETDFFKVRVSLLQQDVTSIVLDETFEFARLVPLKLLSTSNNDNCKFPVNFLFFEVDDVSITSESLYCKMYSLDALPPRFFELDDFGGDAAPAVLLNQTIATCNQRLAALRGEMNACSRPRRARLEIEKAHKLLQVEKLREQVAARRASLASTQLALESEQRHAASVCDIKGDVLRCGKLADSLAAHNKTLDTKKQFLLKAQFLLETRQVKLLSELQAIYPIEQMDSGEHCIRGLELPVDLNSKDDELVASALCYVVHLLLLASKYLEIPLRYQILFLGSRSMIRDPVQGSAGTLPLFRRNVEKERFERAIVWLKRDVEQLLLSRGVYYDHNKDLLQNVHQLFHCETCPKLSV